MGDIVMFWCEKTVTSQNATLEFNDYSTTERKFADGVGKSTITNHEELFIESSSGIAKEAVQHSLDDTIKLIIECTNSLGQSIRHHKNASMTTMCEKEVYAIQVIVNKLTLFKVSLKPELKWKVMEVRSSALPVTWETRFCFLEMFELMATLIVRTFLITYTKY